MTVRPSSYVHAATRRLGAALSAVVLVLVAVTAVAVPDAAAQQSVVGTADFRNAPQLPPGGYVDRIVTGDSAWYAVVYTNNTPYEFAVDFQGVEPGPEVDLSVSFVAPTLTTVDGPASVVSGPGVEYPAGHTNVWFLEVSLATTGQIGVEYPVVIRVSGVQTFGTDPCNDTPGCTLDDEYASNNVALAEATAALETMQAQETRAAVEAEIENLRGFAETGAALSPATQARLARVDARMAELCAPDAMCDEFPDPGSKTPILGWIVGLAALGLGARQAAKRFTGKQKVKEVKPPPRQPTSLTRNKPTAKK